MLLREPDELRRPVARVDVAAGARVYGPGVDRARQPLGRVGRARVAPAEHGRQRLAVAADRNEAVAEAGGAARVDRPGLQSRIAFCVARTSRSGSVSPA